MIIVGEFSADQAGWSVAGVGDLNGDGRGDVLVAFNDRRITFANFEGEFRRRRLGETVALTVLRENRLVQLELEPSETRPEIWTVVELQDATPEQLQLRNRWITSSRPTSRASQTRSTTTGASRQNEGSLVIHWVR